MVVHLAVNERVVGSNPIFRAKTGILKGVSVFT
jgi:hypothetical protein